MAGGWMLNINYNAVWIWKKKVQNLNSTKKTFKLQVYRKNNFEDVGGIFNEIRKKIHKCNIVLFQS